MPTDKVDNEKKLSVAKNPSLLEVHWICELIVPCSGSLAEPQKLTESPSSNEEFADGKVIETVGGWFSGMNSFTVIVTCLESLRRPSSVIVAVMV